MQVTWGNGATIGGSSGSPLIDVTTQKVVGVLTGGYTNCHDRTQSDYYGRLSAVSAPANLCVHILASFPAPIGPLGLRGCCSYPIPRWAQLLCQRHHARRAPPQ